MLEGAIPTTADPVGNRLFIDQLLMDILRARSPVRLAPISVPLSLINRVTR